MTLFSYTGKNQLGDKITGEINAENEAAVAKQLFNIGIFPINIEIKKETKILKSKKLSSMDLLIFTRQLYILVKSGIPLLRAIKSMETSSQNKYLKEIYKDIENNINNGYELNATFQKYTNFFSVFYVNMIKIGEQAGRLEEVLLNLYQYIEFEISMKKSAISAIRYPIFVLGAMAFAFIIVMNFVIPAFAKVYSSFHAQLPLMTRILINTSDFMKHNAIVLLSITIFISITFKNYIKTKQGKLWWDKTKFQIPIIGPIIKKSVLGRFAKALSIMLKSGIPIIQSLGTTALVVDNAYLAKHIIQIRDNIESGNPIYPSFKTSGVFDPLTLEMISTGEESGEFATMMEEVAILYEKEIEYELKTLSTNLEPIIFLFLGALILVFALGVLLPSWDLSTVIIKR